jgi:acyl-CoA synthetase (AMP-forming)/AMP-acid ligase II
VLDAACIGVPGLDMGERLVALVLPDGTAESSSPDELIDLCHHKLAHYKFPREVAFLKTAQRNAMGKINRRPCANHS